MTYSPPDPFPAPRPPQSTAQPSTVQQPTVQPPTVQPPTVQPPAGPSPEPGPTPTPPREWSPVGIISALGVIFVLISGLSVTLRQWGNQGEAIRAVGLTVLAVAATIFADRIRTMAHTTGLATAVLGAGLGFPIGVAFAAWAGRPWPVCLTVGGLIAASIAEGQRRRWSAMTIAGREFQWFDLMQVGALAMGSFGLAAWIHVPAGVVAVVVAAVLFGLGASRRSVALAVIAVAAPVLGILADAGVGAGTLARAGVVGDRLGWAGPLVGVAAGAVVLLAGRRIDNRRLRLLAPPLVLAGFVTGLATVDVGPALWWALPGLLLALAAGTWHVGHFGEQPFDPPGVVTGTDPVTTFRRLLTGFAAASAAVLWLLTPLVATSPVDSAYAVTGLVWAVGLGLCWPIAKRWEADVILVGAAVATTIAASAIASLGPDSSGTRWETAWWLMTGVALVSVAAAAIVTFLAATPVGPVAALTTAFIVVIGAMIGEQWSGASRVVPFLLAAVWLVAAVYAFARFPRPSVVGVILLPPLTIVLTVVAVAVTHADTAFRPNLLGTSIMFAVLAAAAGCTVVPAARPIVGWPVAAVGALTLLVVRAWSASPMLAAAFATTAVAALLWRRWVGGEVPTAIAAGSVGGAAMMTAGALTDAPETVQLVGLTCLALAAVWLGWRGRSVPAIAFAATVALVEIGAALPTAWMAATWCLIGVVVAVIGWRWSQPWITGLGAAITGVAAIVWATTFEIPEWLSDALAAVGLTGPDIAVVLVFAVAVAVARWLLGATKVASIWLFAPPFVFVTMWAVVAEVARHPAWVIPFAIVVGVIAVIVGVQRKVTGLLVGGAVLAVAVVIAASRLTLVLVPGWAWIGVGGIALLATALIVERVAGGWAGVRRQAAYLSQTWR